eukprot:CAMPEP_0171296750 /NCGR_PEP_ID=MMETSP0816-20121228/5470_1 /TAXON_ID=420281 /ORGANISM="Proboscia inermis, Strain CCAP1064/1" /LENGTH=47 /DNA_ID= /DNA_START= /DNA_END= /DNA_ORIENTATION=
MTTDRSFSEKFISNRKLAMSSRPFPSISSTLLMIGGDLPRVNDSIDT